MLYETWCEVPGYNQYLVSDQGRVWNTTLGRELRGYIHHKGMRRVRIMNNEGKYVDWYIHRLVAYCFMEDYTHGVSVELVGNRQDCSVSNLRIGEGRVRDRETETASGSSSK